MASRSIEVLEINYDKNRIQNCTVNMDEKTFYAKWNGTTYEISGEKGENDSSEKSKDGNEGENADGKSNNSSSGNDDTNEGSSNSSSGNDGPSEGSSNSSSGNDGADGNDGPSEGSSNSSSGNEGSSENADGKSSDSSNEGSSENADGKSSENEDSAGAKRETSGDPAGNADESKDDSTQGYSLEKIKKIRKRYKEIPV
jgi:hypothetical protein